MTKIDQIQNQILEKMAETLSNEQLQKLENVMAIEFHGIEVQEECTQLVTSELRWQKTTRSSCRRSPARKKTLHSGTPTSA